LTLLAERGAPPTMVSDNGTELPGAAVLLWSSPLDWRPARRGPLGGTERQSRRRGAPAVPAHPGHQFCSFLLAPPCKSPVRRGERNVCLIIPPVGRSDSAPATGLSEAVPPPPVVLIGLAPHINVRQPGARIKTALLEAWTLPIRLLPTTTTSSVLPFSGIELGIGRRLGSACDPEQ